MQGIIVSTISKHPPLAFVLVWTKMCHCSLDVSCGMYFYTHSAQIWNHAFFS